MLTYGPTQRVESQDVQLRVWGLADEVAFSWEDLMGLPQTTHTYDTHSVTHWSKLDTTWLGLAVPDLMRYPLAPLGQRGVLLT